MSATDAHWTQYKIQQQRHDDDDDDDD